MCCGVLPSGRQIKRLVRQMATRSWQPAIPVAPLPPDFVLCSSLYGANLDARDCKHAAGNLPWGGQPMSYRLDRRPSDFTLPMSVTMGQQEQLYRFTLSITKTQIGNCMVSVEIAGPSPPLTIVAIPNQVRGLAAWVANECVSRGGGHGGFATLMIGNLIGFALNPAISLFRDRLCKSAAPAMCRWRNYADSVDTITYSILHSVYHCHCWRSKQPKNPRQL